MFCEDCGFLIPIRRKACPNCDAPVTEPESPGASLRKVKPSQREADPPSPPPATASSVAPVEDVLVTAGAPSTALASPPASPAIERAHPREETPPPAPVARPVDDGATGTKSMAAEWQVDTGVMGLLASFVKRLGVTGDVGPKKSHARMQTPKRKARPAPLAELDEALRSFDTPQTQNRPRPKSQVRESIADMMSKLWGGGGKVSQSRTTRITVSDPRTGRKHTFDSLEEMPPHLRDMIPPEMQNRLKETGMPTPSFQRVEVRSAHAERYGPDTSDPTGQSEDRHAPSDTPTAEE